MTPKELSLSELNEKVKLCTKCELCATRKNNTLGGGSHDASILFVGESISETESEYGKAFVGRSGQFLRGLVRAVRIPDSKFYVTNIVRCHIPEERGACASELESCWEHTIELLKIIKPKILVPLGHPVLLELAKRLGFKKMVRGRNIKQVAGKIIYHAERKLYILPMFHPSLCLRWADMRMDFESHMYILAKGYPQWEQRKI